MTLSNYPRKKIAITFPTRQLKRAKQKAKDELGFNFPELVRHLVANYLQTQPTRFDSLRISEEGKQIYLRDLHDFYKGQEQNPQPGARSAEELMAQLEADE